MARELVLEAKVDSVEAEAAISRLALAFTKAGDDALTAANKAEKFEKSYKDGQARKAAKAELDALAGSTDKVSTAAGKATTTQTNFNAAILRFVGPAAVGAAVMSTLNWADQLSNLSRATGISTTSLQKFEAIGKTSGVTMDQIANASLQLSNRLAGGDKSAAKAMDRLGLSTAALIRMSPDQAMLEFAGALARVQNPQERVALAMDGLGRSAGALLPTLMDMNDQWDRTTAKLSEDGVKSLDDAGDALDRLMDTGKGLLATVLVPFAPLLEGILAVLTPLSKMFNAFMRDVLSPFDPQRWRDWADSLRDAARSMQYIAGIGPGIQAPLPAAPGSPGGGFMPTPAGPIPLPSNLGIGGPGRIATGGGGGGRVIPFPGQSTFTLGSTAASIFGLANTPGSFSAGTLPFMAGLPFLASGGSPISFGNGSGLAGTVPMNPAGGGGGGIGSWLGGHKTQLAGLGLGLLGQFMPQGGKIGSALSGASQGASMGAMFGPWGMGIGAAIGGITGLFGGGKAAKNAKNAEISQVFEQFSSKDFIELQKQADKFGISMEKALTAKTMKDFGLAVDEVNTKLQEMNSLQSEIDMLTEQTTVSFDQMSAVAKEFGLDINQLGQGFKQAAMDKEAQKIIDAFAIMEKGGADMNGVLDGMQDEISKVVQDSLKFGTTIPENMKPWITKLAETGRLVDENGTKITDVTKLNFGGAMESQMDKLVRKLDELITKLAGVKTGFDRSRDAAADLNREVGSGDWNNRGVENERAGFASGGVAGRDFRRPGHGDVFPALLKRGERVLPPGAAGSGLSIGNITINGGYRSRAEAVEEIGEGIVAYVERRGGRLVA